MFTDLVTAWNEYQAKVNAVPYCRDAVQAYGMKFCSIFKSKKLELCELIDIPEDEFNYGLKYQAMSIILKDSI